MVTSTVFGTPAKNLQHRQAGEAVGLAQLSEGGGFAEAHADEQADGDQHDAQQEEDAPPPRQQVIGWEGADRDEDAGGGGHPQWKADLHEAAVEASATGRSMLDDHQDCAAPFAAEAKTLDEAQDDQKHGGQDADLGVGRQPIRKVPPPMIIMIIMVSISMVLRPSRSPKWPNTMPPRGRAANPTA